MYLRIIYVGEVWMRCEGRNVAGDEMWLRKKVGGLGMTCSIQYTKESARWATETGSRGST